MNGLDMTHVTIGRARIPALGFGTFRMSEAEVAEVLPAALAQGFHHVDTAQIYENEAAVGKAIERSCIARDEVFLTTKVWVGNFSPDRFQASVENSLRKLKTDYVDLLLLHWPVASDVPRATQIAELNRARERGLARHIGVSNYTISQMREAVELSAAPLVTARDYGLSLTGYFSLADGKAAHDRVLAEIGFRHSKTAAQVALRWLVQQENVIALTKTATVSRLAENIALFDFVLSAEDMAAIHALSKPDGRIVSPEGLAPYWG
ncbi:aldo/keto reductase [Cypionkella sp.]|uniref:aldo/keto reductase n=1 Tax=Cypionkella sp. TaxID=2811411 RepID=UPI002ABC1C90|nr:aldo/keto reductase [Cypionkella sp.]MDZ4393439.1 aldo/keto reductase [Cypionkella sp.]